MNSKKAEVIVDTVDKIYPVATYLKPLIIEKVAKELKRMEEPQESIPLDVYEQTKKVIEDVTAAGATEFVIMALLLVFIVCCNSMWAPYRIASGILICLFLVVKYFTLMSLDKLRK